MKETAKEIIAKLNDTQDPMEYMDIWATLTPVEFAMTVHDGLNKDHFARMVLVAAGRIK
jgi:hypothetical protein